VLAGDKEDNEVQGRGAPNNGCAAPPDGTQAWIPSKRDNVLRGALRDGTTSPPEHGARREFAGRFALGARTSPAASITTTRVWQLRLRPRGLPVALETSREVVTVDAHRKFELLRTDTGGRRGLAPDGKTLVSTTTTARSASTTYLLAAGKLNSSPLVSESDH
jgi:hypothetical protein